MFSDCERVRYGRPQLVEVICQLRFPTILSIDTKAPADFQEEIRGKYPVYSRKVDKIAPKLVGQGGNVKLEEQPAVTNHQFVSADGKWRVNLTKDFLALATSAYTCWEEFAQRLDELLAQFINTYRPAFFERIGLRYINAFSRKELDLEGVPFSELIQPAYLGLMAEEDVREQNFIRVTQNVELNLPGGCRLKLHAGPGMVKRNSLPDDREIRFILDQDIFMSGKIEMKHSTGALTTIHTHAHRIFRGAITQQLHEAMEPFPL